LHSLHLRETIPVTGTLIRGVAAAASG
jgi:hypothetical protein